MLFEGEAGVRSAMGSSECQNERPSNEPVEPEKRRSQESRETRTEQGHEPGMGDVETETVMKEVRDGRGTKRTTTDMERGEGAGRATRGKSDEDGDEEMTGNDSRAPVQAGMGVEPARGAKRVHEGEEEDRDDPMEDVMAMEEISAQ